MYKNVKEANITSIFIVDNNHCRSILNVACIQHPMQKVAG